MQIAKLLILTVSLSDLSFGAAKVKKVVRFNPIPAIKIISAHHSNSNLDEEHIELTVQEKAQREIFYLYWVTYLYGFSARSAANGPITKVKDKSWDVAYKASLKAVSLALGKSGVKAMHNTLNSGDFSTAAYENAVHAAADAIEEAGTEDPSEKLMIALEVAWMQVMANRENLKQEIDEAFRNVEVMAAEDIDFAAIKNEFDLINFRLNPEEEEVQQTQIKFPIERQFNFFFQGMVERIVVLADGQEPKKTFEEFCAKLENRSSSSQLLLGSIALVGLGALAYFNAYPEESSYEMFANLRSLEDLNLSEAEFRSRLKKLETKIDLFFSKVDKKLLHAVNRLQNAKAKKASKKASRTEIKALTKELTDLKPNKKVLQKILQYQALRRELWTLKLRHSKQKTKAS